MTTPHIRDFRDQRVHMIGIGGSSMSGLAQMLLDQGYHITGSDNTHSHAVERLEAEGVQVFIGHDARQNAQHISIHRGSRFIEAV